MSFIKKLTNERGEAVFIWKIIRQTVETLANTTTVTLYGFTSDEQKQKYLTAPASHRTVVMDGIFDGKEAIYTELNEATATDPVTEEVFSKYEFGGSLNSKEIEKDEDGLIVLPDNIPDLESDPFLK